MREWMEAASRVGCAEVQCRKKLVLSQISAHSYCYILHMPLIALNKASSHCNPSDQLFVARLSSKQPAGYQRTVSLGTEQQFQTSAI